MSTKSRQLQTPPRIDREYSLDSDNPPARKSATRLLGLHADARECATPQYSDLPHHWSGRSARSRRFPLACRKSSTV